MPLQLGSDIFRAIDLTLACDVAFSVSSRWMLEVGEPPTFCSSNLEVLLGNSLFKLAKPIQSLLLLGDPAFLGAEIFSQDGKLVRSPPQGNVWLRAPVGERISEVIWGTKKANLVR